MGVFLSFSCFLFCSFIRQFRLLLIITGSDRRRILALVYMSAYTLGTNRHAVCWLWLTFAHVWSAIGSRHVRLQLYVCSGELDAVCRL